MKGSAVCRHTVDETEQSARQDKAQDLPRQLGLIRLLIVICFARLIRFILSSLTRCTREALSLFAQLHPSPLSSLSRFALLNLDLIERGQRADELRATRRNNH